MTPIRLALVSLAGAALALGTLSSEMKSQGARAGQAADTERRERFGHNNNVEDEDAGPSDSARTSAQGDTRGRLLEAPTGFDNRTNGFDRQGPPFESLNEDTVVPLTHRSTTIASSLRKSKR